MVTPMHSIALGPFAFAFALDHLLWLACLLTIGWVGALVAAAPRPDFGRLLWPAALVGVVVARLAFVVLEFDLYRAAPAALLDVRDGGYVPWLGWLALLGVLAWSGWRTPALRRPLGAGVLAAGLLWAGASLVLGRHERPLIPPLALQTLAGEAVQLDALGRGQPVIVNLWASWCPPCRREMPAFVAEQQRQGRSSRQPVRILLVNQGEDAATVQDYLGVADLAPHDVLLDRGAQLGARVGSSGLPTTLFFDADGRLVDRHMGPLSDVSLRARVRALGGGN